MPNATSTTARQAILSCIDSALGPSTANPATELEAISRDYIRTDSLSGAALIELFIHRISDYGAAVHRAKPDEILLAIEKALHARAARNFLIPAGLPAEWLPAGFAFTSDSNFSHDQLNVFEGVLTTATVAIAATGSIVLQHGQGQGRRALTLIPDYHLCVVYTHQIFETVPAAFNRLDPLLPTTFISGPSATADIEMTRIKGVHGPRFMDVILVDANRP